MNQKHRNSTNVPPVTGVNVGNITSPHREPSATGRPARPPVKVENPAVVQPITALPQILIPPAAVINRALRVHRDSSGKKEGSCFFNHHILSISKSLEWQGI
jgi:hypothetical protein